MPEWRKSNAMMPERSDKSNLHSDDTSAYLPTFLDESEEQLDDLVETMLALERDTTDPNDLNEAFRLIHSVKGSAGMMGFDSITVLTHHLENRFERFRSGTAQLDEPTMNLVLRCVDFLRQCINRLRVGDPLGTSTELLDELRRLEEQPEEIEPTVSSPADSVAQPPESPRASPALPETSSDEHDDEEVTHILVQFRPDLQLTDLKAQLIVVRLSKLGEIVSTRPDVESTSIPDPLEDFEVRLKTTEPFDRLRSVADVEGVESITISESQSDTAEQTRRAPTPSAEVRGDDSKSPKADVSSVRSASPRQESQATIETSADDSTSAETSEAPPIPPQAEPRLPVPPVVARKSASKVAETMRVDIDRLDGLMNLVGELVINRARLIQIAGRINPAFRKASMPNRIRDFSAALHNAIERLEGSIPHGEEWSSHIQQLRSGLELMEEQSAIWDNGRKYLGQMDEALDQLSRVSHNLQRGVLETRMVPVGPLFNRFGRVVRDLSRERGKKVSLTIRGEKTELDKRMIDELGDPLTHLVRNSIDHGLESPEERASKGKPEEGTICLEARHNGNNVYIDVRDDGRGIDVAKVKARLIENQLLPEATVRELPDDQALDYIWSPGFSTATTVTDVSGRGVGMDVVKTRIHQLNGSVEIDSAPDQGTTFTIRLPLTLAIINSLLVRLRNVVMSMPIDDVREIVAVNECDLVTVMGKQTLDVRDEFIPVVSIDDVFDWHEIDYGQSPTTDEHPTDSAQAPINVVILHAGRGTVGLRVDELLGSQDVVVKSLSDNLMSIRGLSGASILGDGRVCLMLDVGTVTDLAFESSRTTDSKESVR
jgi:two-component system chemotaxis sensor kinase CheA